MKCTILHEGKGRMRVHVEKVRMTLHRRTCKMNIPAQKPENRVDISLLSSLL